MGKKYPDTKVEASDRDDIGINLLKHFYGSLVKSMSKFRYRQFNECMIEGVVQIFFIHKTIHLFDRQFGFISKPLYYTRRKSRICVKPIHYQLLSLSILETFFIGPGLVRLVRLHHFFKNFAAIYFSIDR